MKNMFMVTNRIPVAKGMETAFEERFRERAGLVDKEPGFIRNQVMRPVFRRRNRETGEFEVIEEQGYYLVQTYWESEEAFWNWTQSDSFRKAHSKRPPSDMFAGLNKLEIHELVFTTES